MPNSNFCYLEGGLFRYEEMNFRKGSVLSKLTVTVLGPRNSTSYLLVDAWNLAPQLRDLLDKSAKKCRVCVKGQVVQDTWKDKKTGNKRSMIKILADMVNYLPAIKEKNSDQSHSNTIPDTADESSEDLDDVPF